MRSMELALGESLPPVWVTDPAVVAAGVVELSGVELERLKFWKCPCCDVCKVVYAQDAKGRVWLSLTMSFNPKGQIIRIDTLDEVEGLLDTIRDDDYDILCAWYEAGLQEELIQLFVS